MTYNLYDYVSLSGRNEFKKWTHSLQSGQRGKLAEKLDKLAQHGDDLYPQMLSGTPVPGIQKLRVHGNVQLRPLLCNGPIFNDKEYTLLMGAKEVGGIFVPTDAPNTAKNRKDQVIFDHDSRRIKHE